MTFRKILLSWYRKNARALPWRGTRDPYVIWLSEMILQQTRIEQGLPYFHRFMAAYPDVGALAAASEDELLKLWQGLGYYARARNLLKTAREVIEKHQGTFPGNYNDLLKLKGIGPYSAAAIASFAFGEKVPVTDGNVFRFLSRYSGSVIPIDTSQARNNIRDLAYSLMGDVDPGTFNQALMEFGALHCVPAQPVCHSCPFSHACAAFQTGQVQQIPNKKSKIKVRYRFFHYLVCIFRDVRNSPVMAVKKRQGKDIWRSLYDFPLIETQTIRLPASQELQIPQPLRQLLKTKPCWTSPEIKHVLTHRTIRSKFYLYDLPSRITAQHLPDGYRLISPEDFHSLAVPRLIDKVWRERIEPRIKKIVAKQMTF